jgi:adenylosuccinate synthase
MKDNKIFVIAGLGYGDEGKGTVTDYLARKHNVRSVVRYNGGPQAGHNVVTPGGLFHCFAQFGSGALIPGVKTFLSRYMLINPIAIEVENEVLQEKGINDALDRLIIDKKCPVITPFNIIINRMLEASRGKARHGSCGKGIRQTVTDQEQYGDMILVARDLINKKITQQKLNFFWQVKVDLAEQIAEEHPSNKKLKEYLKELMNIDIDLLAERYRRFASMVQIGGDGTLSEILEEGNVIFEGAQGVLLDMDFGFWPYVTSTKTTFANAEELIAESNHDSKVTKIGILRAYGTRHGPGPFVTEDREMIETVPSCHNGTNEWQGPLRVGAFDLVTTRYGIDVVGGIDYLFLTNLDRLSGLNQLNVCTAYKHPNIKTDVIDHYFHLNTKETKIREIKPLVKQGLVPNDQITKLLNECKPVYHTQEGYGFDPREKIPSGMRNYISFLEKEADVRIATISVGPTTADKFEL